MKTVFWDTNILIDYYANRPGADAAQQMLRIANAKELDICSSVLTFANFAYVAWHNHTREQVFSALDRFERLIHVLPMDRIQLREAINHPCRDFEDRLQYQCALAARCDVIITNNKKDFVDYSQLPLFTAAEFLNELILAHH